MVVTTGKQSPEKAEEKNMKFKHVLIFAVTLLTVIAVGVFPTQHTTAASAKAQQTHDMSAMSTNASVIDGSIHPEQVTDNAAYRLFFLSVAPSTADSPVEQTRKHRVLSEHAKLSALEELYTQQVLSDFKTEYDALVATYNEAAIKASNTSNPNDATALKTFLASRDQLVDHTRARLSTGFSAKGLGSLHAHVQREKSNMHVAVE